MTLQRFIGPCAVVALIALAGMAVAQEGRNALYLGAGPAPTGFDENQDTPFSFGVYHVDPHTQFLMGFDIGLEGTRFDGTYGIDTLEQATSFNLLLGRSVYQDSAMAVDLAVVLGFRETAADCADSYIGWACYADVEPEYEYDLNYGGLATVTFQTVMVGLRATESSVQLVAGISF